MATTMADRDGWIWYDGKLAPWRNATTHVLTHSLHYGLAVFEGVRAYKTVDGTAIFRLKEHTERLYNSAHIYMMKSDCMHGPMVDVEGRERKSYLFAFIDDMSRLICHGEFFLSQ